VIGRIEGVLIEKTPPRVLVDCSGVGYEIDVPMSTLYGLPAVGARIVLLTQFIVREDAQLLYGFATSEERVAFRELVKVSGIGPRTALSVLSGLSVNELAQAVTLQDVTRLKRIPGIGPKTAERLALELKGKLGADLGTAPAASSSSADVLQALIALGYSEKEALAACKGLAADLSVNEGIKAALKLLAK
jgi:holliday junction DNA helicase RuvA